MLFNHLKENINIKYYILCLHFNCIKQELLTIFHTFMNETNLSFILLTDEISFLTSSILRNSIIKKIKSNKISIYNKCYKERTNIIINDIIENNNKSFFIWRENLYNLLIMNDNIYDCFTYIIESLILKNYLNETNIDKTMNFYYNMIYKYNNNYRTIYHLEHFITYLRNIKNN